MLKASTRGHGCGQRKSTRLCSGVRYEPPRVAVLALVLLSDDAELRQRPCPVRVEGARLHRRPEAVLRPGPLGLVSEIGGTRMNEAVATVALGEFAEGMPWEIVRDYQIYAEKHSCPHCVWSVGQIVCPLVVRALNEAGHNETGVCLACILDAAKELEKSHAL